MPASQYCVVEAGIVCPMPDLGTPPTQWHADLSVGVRGYFGSILSLFPQGPRTVPNTAVCGIAQQLSGVPISSPALVISYSSGLKSRHGFQVPQLLDFQPKSIKTKTWTGSECSSCICGVGSGLCAQASFN